MAGDAVARAAVELTGSVDVFRFDAVTLHSYASPLDGELVRSQIIETRDGILIIDVQLLRRYAAEVRRYVDSLGKPIRRVIISHWHPDHWFGIEAFADSPLYALPDVIDQLTEMGQWWIDLRKADLGAEIPDRPILPTHPIEEGREVIDGVELDFTRVAEGESLSSLYAELPQINTLIAQDLIYNKVYPFVGELHGPDRTIKCFDGWLNALGRLRGRNYELVLPGHGEPTDQAAIAEMMDSLGAIKAIVESASDAREFKRRVVERFPDHQMPLMLDLSAMTLYPTPLDTEPRLDAT